MVNLPLYHLAEQSVKLDREAPVVAVCNSAYRSSLAIGILEREGFGNVRSLAGGGEAWVEAGLPVIESGAACPVPAGGSQGQASAAWRRSPGGSDLAGRTASGP